MTEREHHEFQRAKLIVERVHRKLGLPRQYLARDWKRDQELMRDLARRKRELRRQEQAQVAQFESWRHGQPVVEIGAEAPEEQRAS
jgi:hypothetical protein